MANNEVAVVDFKVAQIEPDYFESIKEEMEGLGELPMERIKIPSGGAVAFEVPGDDPDSPDMVKELRGVIVAHSPQNTYWAQAYSGAKEAPTCFSPDGKCGIVFATGEIRTCADCFNNQFGSGVDMNGNATRGKACKNSHKLYLLQEDSILPVVIDLPPTSIKAWKDYLAKRLLLRGKKPSQVVTKISLKKITGGDVPDFSQCVFTKESDLPAETVKNLEPLTQMVKQYMRRGVVSAIEGKEVKPLDVMPDEEIPF